MRKSQRHLSSLSVTCFLLFAGLFVLIVFSSRQEAASRQVVVTEFSDFQCPYCQRAAGVVEQLRAYYGERVKFVFKQMPLKMHKQAFKAAQAAVCANEQERFWEYHDRLFSTRELSVDSLNRMASEVGLNESQFSQCMESDSSRATVAEDLAEADRLGVTGTPTFFLNGHALKGAATFAALKIEIDQAMATKSEPARDSQALQRKPPHPSTDTFTLQSSACVPFPTPSASACPASEGGLATDLLSLYPSNPSLTVGCSGQFSVLLSSSPLQCDITSRIQQWTSSNTSVATISTTGQVLALSVGTTTITATEFIGTSAIQSATTLTVVGATPTPTPTPTPSPSPTPTPTPLPPFTLSQTNIDFGYLMVGTGSAQTIETITNSGTAPLVIKDLSISGRDRSDFKLNYDFSLPITISPANGVSINISFSPALPWRAGKRSAKLEIDQKKSSSYVSLSGIGANCGGPLPGCSSGCADTDGDGLNNSWEMDGGVDMNNDGVITATDDLLLAGAERNKPDVFVWYDWMDYGGNDQSCATADNCLGLGSFHNGETCNDQGQCVYSCSTDSDCTSRSPADVHAGERCVSNVCEHTHDPLILGGDPFQPVIDRFAAHSINLHVLRGTAQPHSHVISRRTNAQMTVGCEGANLLSGNVGVGKYAVSFSELKSRSNPDKLNVAYHYVVFSHYSGCDSLAHCPADSATSTCWDSGLTYGQTGMAEFSGNDFVVSLGGAVNDSALSLRLQLAGTFMHELGHDLGLRHDGHLDQPCANGAACPAGEVCTELNDGQGLACHEIVGGLVGNEEPNYKPNYLSVMNYRYSRGIRIGAEIGSRLPRTCHVDADCGGNGAICLGGCVRLDYSNQILPTGGPTPGALDETNLDDIAGLGSGTADLFTYEDALCHVCWITAPSTGPVNWVGTGIYTNNLCELFVVGPESFTDTGVQADLDALGVCTEPRDLMHGHVDWPDLSGVAFNYKFQCTPNGK